jgi:predicted DNA-binding protein
MAKRKPQSSDGMQMLNVRIARQQVERLRVVAEADHRTVSQELRRLIEQRIAESEPERRAA